MIGRSTNDRMNGLRTVMLSHLRRAWFGRSSSNMVWTADAVENVGCFAVDDVKRREEWAGAGASVCADERDVKGCT